MKHRLRLRLIVRIGINLCVFKSFREKRIVPFFLAHSRHRPVSGQTIVSSGNVRIFSRLFRNASSIGNVAAAHRAGKKRIAHDRHRTGKTRHDKSHPARRMTRGQSRIDLERSEPKTFSFLDRLRAVYRFRAEM